MSYYDIMLINVAVLYFAGGFLLATLIYLIREYRKLQKKGDKK